MLSDEIVRTYSTSYKNLKSIVIENDKVRAEIVPELGGKIVSLIYKPSGKQWLLDSGERQLLQPVFGSTFIDWDMSGWDECFPTINACSMHDHENKTIPLPDHGEVWSLPWSCEIQDRSIICSVEGVGLPYRLTRSISFQKTGQVRLKYKVDNLGEKSLPFLWAAHPQFAISEPTRILLPDSMHYMLCVYGGKQLITGINYEVTSFMDIHPMPTGDGKKFYYPGIVPAGWSGLYGKESNNYLIISTPVEKVPYLGIWIDEGICNDRVTCAIEPGIGYYDSLERSESNGSSGIINPNQSYAWHLDLDLGQRLSSSNNHQTLEI